MIANHNISVCLNYTYIFFPGLEMSEDNLSVILVYPPFRGFPTDEFFIQAFNDIYPYVEAVSVMTYDFSSPQKPGKSRFNM